MFNEERNINKTERIQVPTLQTNKRNPNTKARPQQKNSFPQKKKFYRIGRLAGPIEQYTTGAYPELLPPTQAIDAFNVSKEVVLSILTKHGYIQGGKTTDKIREAKLAASCNGTQLWNVEALHDLLNTLNAGKRKIRRKLLNQEIPEGVAEGVYEPIEKLCTYFDVPEDKFKKMLYKARWWLPENYEEAEGTFERSYGAPREWVINRGFAKKFPVSTHAGEKTYTWVLDSWHVVKTLSGQFENAPIPKNAIVPINHVIKPPKPTVPAFLGTATAALKDAVRKKNYKFAKTIVSQAYEYGDAYVNGLENACKLPKGFFRQRGWADALIARGLN